MTYSSWALMLGLAMLFPPPTAVKNDVDGIRQAVLDYANSAYEVRPDLIEESVHPKLQKVGYVARNGQPYSQRWRNFYELKELVSTWNLEGRFDSASARRKVVILDQLDRTAVARLDAEWGIDFLHLVKDQGRWMIIHVVWQTYPPDS